MVKITIKTKHKRGASALREVCQLMDGRVWKIETIEIKPLTRALILNPKVPIKKIDVRESKQSLENALENRGAKPGDYELEISGGKNV